MPLERLVTLINEHRSLQHVQILATEGYSKRGNGVVHRFILLELRFLDGKSAWLRLDRRRDRSVNVLVFILAWSVSPAEDTVRCVLLLASYIVNKIRTP